MKGKKITALILCAAVTMSLFAGCGSTPAEQPSAAESAAETAAAQENKTAPTADASRKTTADSQERYDKVAIGMISDPKDLGPTSMNGDNSKLFIYYNFYETLFDFRNNEYIPILAKGYTEVDDLHWDVEIYDYIYDTQGNHITADDVVFSLNLLVESGNAFKFDSFESAEKIDDYTVRFTWTSPINSLGALEWPWCRTCIISQKAYEEGNFTDAPVATGPYQVKEFVSGSYCLLEANDNYWQKDELRDPEHLANVQTIEYDVIAETSQHVIALSTGQIQYSEYIPAENLADFSDGGQYADGYDVYVTQGSGLYMLMCNNYAGKLTEDVNLRKAIYYALDNEAIAAATGNTVAAKALGSRFFSDYYPAWEENPENYMASCDLEKAKEYLAKSNYNGETLKLLAPSDETIKTMMTMMQALLLQAGINVEIVAEEAALAQTDMLDASKWDLLIAQIGGGSQVGEWNRPMNNTEFGTEYNMAFIADDTLQEKLLSVNSIEGHTEENQTDMVNYILENGYYYAICSPATNAVFSEDFATLTYRESEFLRAGSCDYYLE